jgi:hypothetical protein
LPGAQIDIQEAISLIYIMIGFKRQHAARAAIAILYGLAMLVLQFAHHPIASGDSRDLSAYALPDGTLPVIC